MSESSLLDLLSEEQFRLNMYYLEKLGVENLKVNDYIVVSWLLNARKESILSLDPICKVGAIIVHNQVILAKGHNHFPNEATYSKDQIEIMMSHRKYTLKHIIHAEHDAISNLLDQNKKLLSQSTMYVYPCQPCAACAQHIADAGIKKIVAPIHNDCDSSCSTCRGFKFDEWQTSFQLAKDIFAQHNIEYILVPIKNIQALFPALPLISSSNYIVAKPIEHLHLNHST